ncbi:MAG: hypothetical protein ACTSUR_08390, partial [Candidatus Heimdallarchaeaceae archaeon]
MAYEYSKDKLTTLFKVSARIFALVSDDFFLNKYEPSVSHTWHYSIAGLMWMGVGIMLTVYAAQWLAAVDKELIWLIIIPSFIGIIAAFLIYYFGFSKLVEK